MPGQPSILGLLSLDCTPVVHTDPAVPVRPSTLVIERASGTVLSTNITLDGAFRGMFTGNIATVKFFAEGLGTLNDVQLGLDIVLPAFGPQPGPAVPWVVPVASPLINGINLPPDGLYKLTVVVTLAPVAGPAACFNEGPVIQIITGP
jgi:hypothetical protein